MSEISHVLLVLLSFLIGNTLHEFGHAYAADLLGDDTPRSQGRISLNPIDHLDPIGTIVVVMTAFAGGMFGWGKPVQVNLNNFKNPRRDDLLVTFAGPFMNLFLASLCAYLLRSNAFHQASDSLMTDFLFVCTELNVVLFLFNLIPVPPLDGSHILGNLLPGDIAVSYGRFMSQYSLVFLMLVVAFGWYIIEQPFKTIFTALLG